MPRTYRLHDQTEFLISPAASDLKDYWFGRIRGRLDIASSHCAEPPYRAGNKGDRHEITEDRRPRRCGLAAHGHRDGTRVDERSGSGRSDREVLDAAVSLVKPPACSSSGSEVRLFCLRLRKATAALRIRCRTGLIAATFSAERAKA